MVIGAAVQEEETRGIAVSRRDWMLWKIVRVCRCGERGGEVAELMGWS